MYLKVKVQVRVWTVNTQGYSPVGDILRPVTSDFPAVI